MSSSSTSTFEKSSLWKLLSEKTAADDDVRTILLLCAAKIESILAKGGTALPDFTLHDNDHGFRVAETMRKLLPENMCTSMGTYEIALLLLSAYLHDIGMTPTRDKVQRHYRYIQTGDKTLLPEREIEDLRRWLDEEQGGIDLPISSGRPTAGDLEQADVLLAYYCRFRHNDWSEEWIREELGDLSPALYPDWLQDLVTLCRSHHEGLHDLQGARFDAKLAGTPSQVINLRYLAALLRVADILEFDPERTPEIILRHRNIRPSSKIFWAKDHAISLSVDPKRSQIFISARTPDAKIHRAVLETLQAVNDELFCCDALKHANAYARGVTPSSRPEYNWIWPARATEDIRERDSSFEYIDGSFRPDAHKVLSLLSGTALYGDPFAAVRELVQNAFDGVNEQVAYQRLARSVSDDDPAFIANLRGTHSVAITFYREADSYWLSCLDTGVGMTKRIIERYFLVSGAAQRPDLVTLERHCRQRGFTTERLGQFGIGVLSYFMIADQISIRTRRSDASGGDPDQKAWRFEIEEATGFGQLTPYSTSTSGTEVKLRLRRDAIKGDPGTWLSSLVSYLSGSLVYVPCRFFVKHEGIKVFEIGHAGWSSSTLAFSDKLFSQAAMSLYEGDTDRLMPSDEIARVSAMNRLWEECKQAMSAKLRWYGPVEGEFDGAQGRWRIYISYFELFGGASLVFMRIDGNSGILLPDRSHAIEIDNLELHAWRGIRALLTRSTPATRRGVFGHHKVELLPTDTQFALIADWTAGGEISVDRSTLTIDDAQLTSARTTIARATVELAKRFLNDHASSDYASFNQVLLARQLVEEDFEIRIPIFAISKKLRDRTDNFAWRAVEYPVAEVNRRTLSRPASVERIDAGGRELGYSRIVNLPGYRRSISPFLNLPGKRLLLLREGAHLVPAPLWETAPSSREGAMGFETLFPSEWNGLCVILVDQVPLWNKEHPLVRTVTRSSWNWVVANVPRGDPRQQAENIAKDRAVIAALFLHAIVSRLDVDRWRAIRESVPALVDAARSMFSEFGDASSIVRVWDVGGRFGNSNDTLEISADAAEQLENIPLSHRGGGLPFPSGFILPWPTDPRWFGQVVSRPEDDPPLDR